MSPGTPGSAGHVRSATRVVRCTVAGAARVLGKRAVRLPDEGAVQPGPSRYRSDASSGREVAPLRSAVSDARGDSERVAGAP